LQNQLPLHQLVAHRPAACPFHQVVVVPRRMPCRIANYALYVVAHLLWRDLARYRKTQKARGHDRHQPYRKQIHEFKTWISPVDEPLPGSGDRLEIEVEARTGAAVEEAAQQRKRLRQRAEITDDDPQLALLAHRELRRVRLESAQFLQKDARPPVKGSPGFGQ